MYLEIIYEHFHTLVLKGEQQPIDCGRNSLVKKLNPLFPKIKLVFKSNKLNFPKGSAKALYAELNSVIVIFMQIFLREIRRNHLHWKK